MKIKELKAISSYFLSTLPKKGCNFTGRYLLPSNQCWRLLKNEYSFVVFQK